MAAASAGFAQDDTKKTQAVSNATVPKEIVISATKTKTKAIETPYSIDVIDQQKLNEHSFRTVPQALRNTPGVSVQETSAGQGSPYIRGFTSQRTLFLIDGIRLNNSVFREGPNQYWSTVDGFLIDRFEVVKGPSSVLYGSDAIGGTVNAFTRRPYTWNDPDGLAVTTYYRVADGENSHMGRVEGSFQLSDTAAVLVGSSYKTVGDIVGGSDIGVMRNTGYDQADGDFKLEKYISDTTLMTLAYQITEQNNLPRTHSTAAGISFAGTTIGSDVQRDFDQSRELAYLRFETEGVNNRSKLTIFWHNQWEAQDRIRSSLARTISGIDVQTTGFQYEIETRNANDTWTYGIEYYHDDVDSFSTGSTIQGPVGDDSTYHLLGLYVQDQIKVDEKNDLILGGRFTWAAFESDSVRNPVTSNQIGLDDQWTSIDGSFRFVHKYVQDQMHFYGGVSQGFRAPNLSDTTRDDFSRSGEAEIPVIGLEPEEFIAYEIGLKSESPDKKLSTQLSLFYTDVKNMIVRVPTGAFIGPDAVVTKRNAGDGYSQGIEFGAAYRTHPQWTLFGNVAWIESRINTFLPASTTPVEEYFDKHPPLAGQVGVRYDVPNAPTWIELLTRMAERADKMSTADLGDSQRMGPGGTPGYAVVHLRAGTKIGDNTEITFGVENVGNMDYRIHGSGTNMPGRNLFFSWIQRW